MSTANTPGPTAMTGSSRPVHRRLVLAICCLSVVVTGVDLSIVNVALPSIGRDLHALVSSLQWMVDASSLVMACLFVLSGSLADRFGRKRIFQLGLALFTVSSLVCSVAPGIGWLIAFRGLQAVGGSMLNPVAMAVIATGFTDQRERARAIGVLGSAIGIAVAVGPVLGGLLVSGVGWRSVFWFNVPVGIAAIALTQAFIPESKAARGRAFDPPGQALIIVLFASIIAATIEGPRHGWADPWIVGLLVLAAAALIGILVVEPRRSEPLIDLRFFRSPPFAGANVISVVMTAGLGGLLFLNTLYLQDLRHLTPLHAGLMIIPLAAGQAVSADLSGRLVASRGARLPLTLGGTLIAVGGFLLHPLTLHTASIYLLAAYAVFGIGMVSPAVSNAAVSGLPPDQVAVTGSIVAGTGAGFINSSHTALAVIGGCGLAVLALGLVSTSSWAKAAAARNGRRLATAPASGSQDHPLPSRSADPTGARKE